MPGPHQFILASASPRRAGLLAQINRVPDQILIPDVDETPFRGELPAAHVLRLAREKADAVARLPEASGAFVLAADTVVACGRRILPKAEDAETARTCLRLLSGRRHRVHGGVAVVAPGGEVRTRRVETAVTFKRLDAAEIERYIASDEWNGKAGGYAIQGLAAIFVRFLGGSYFNVVGLPLYETNVLLDSMGCPASAPSTSISTSISAGDEQ